MINFDNMPSYVKHIPFGPALEQIKDRIARAADRARRVPGDVEILAVTKSVSPEEVAQAWDLGLHQFGESRVQEAETKRTALAGRFPTTHPPRWHLIGHLQTNKVRRAVDLFDCIQSVDSPRLAELLNREGERRARAVSCLVEVKISEEAAKQGLPPDQLSPFLEQAARWSFLRVEGLMGVPPMFADSEDARPYFARLRSMFERSRSHFWGPHPLLSMGMSQDFEVAVEEGSTLVRIGSALFGARRAQGTHP